MTEHAEIGPMTWVLTPTDVVALGEAIRTAETVVFDLETTGLNEYAYTGGPSNRGVSARVSLATFTLPQKNSFGAWDGVDPTTWIVPLSHPDSPFLGTWRSVLRNIMKVVLSNEKSLEGQNVKFDSRWVYATTGVDVSDRITWDTRVSSHLLDENKKTALKVRASEVYGIPPWNDHDLSYPGASEDVPLFELGEYGARDTYWTWKLSHDAKEMMFIYPDSEEPMDREEVQLARLGNLARWVAMPTVVGLSKIEQRGFKLDIPWTENRLKQERESSRQALESLSDKYEMDFSKASTAPTSHWFRDLMERATEANDVQVASLTPSGKPQWTKSVLEKQARAGSETAELVLKTREGAKRSEFLSSWLGQVSRDGTIHASYNAGVVVTGRLSSSNPNMQQVTKALKPAFIPRDGFVLAEIDYSQIELRVAAHISGCKPMIEAFNEGQDLHRLLAARIAGKSPEDVTPEERQKGKSANFGLLYGMGAYGFQAYAETAYGVDMSVEEAVDVHEAFFDQWKGMRQWHRKMGKIVSRDGEVVSPIGRVRRLPDAIFGDEKAAAAAERNAINSPVQGFASDLMQMAAASIMGALPGFSKVDGAHVVATVHDSIVVELSASEWEASLAECQSRMTDDLYDPVKHLGCDLSVPLVADATVGTRWGQDDIKGEDD